MWANPQFFQWYGCPAQDCKLPFYNNKPNLGVVNIDAENAFVMADIPGLIEGAHQGVGLGHEF